MMAASFIPRAVFPTLDSLPRSYYLGHHAAALAKMRAMLSQIDIIIECRDYRIPLSSANPMFEDVLAGRERIIVYTKQDLGSKGDTPADEQVRRTLCRFHSPLDVRFSNHKSSRDIRGILDVVKQRNMLRGSLTGSQCIVVGMPNVGKSSLLNALRQSGLNKGKVAHTGAQPGVTRKIGTTVKIVDGAETGDGGVYVLDTPGVFIPYVPDADAMLKLALCGSVKDSVIPPFTLADYLLFHINTQNPGLYNEYHKPTNEIMQLLEAIARKTGRLQKGGIPDLDGTAMWMIQRWRNGYLGRFLLDRVDDDTIMRYTTAQSGPQNSLNQARKAGKEAARELAKARRASAAC